MIAEFESRQFAEELEWLLEAVHDNPLSPLHSVRFDGDYIVASDGYRLHAVPTTSGLKMTVPASVARLWLEAIQLLGPVMVAIEGDTVGAVEFRAGGIGATLQLSIISTAGWETGLNWRPLVESKGSRIVVETKALKKAISLVRRGREPSEGVRVVANGDLRLIAGEGDPQIVTIREGKNTEVEVKARPRYMLDAIGGLQGEHVRLSVHDNGVLSLEGDDGYRVAYIMGME